MQGVVKYHTGPERRLGHVETIGQTAARAERRISNDFKALSEKTTPFCALGHQRNFPRSENPSNQVVSPPVEGQVATL
jgi:hypothetical protein